MVAGLIAYFRGLPGAPAVFLPVQVKSYIQTLSRPIKLEPNPHDPNRPPIVYNGQDRPDRDFDDDSDSDCDSEGFKRGIDRRQPCQLPEETDLRHEALPFTTSLDRRPRCAPRTAVSSVPATTVVRARQVHRRISPRRPRSFDPQIFPLCRLVMALRCPSVRFVFPLRL